MSTTPIAHPVTHPITHPIALHDLISGARPCVADVLPSGVAQVAYPTREDIELREALGEALGDRAREALGRAEPFIAAARLATEAKIEAEVARLRRQIALTPERGHIEDVTYGNGEYQRIVGGEK